MQLLAQAFGMIKKDLTAGDVHMDSAAPVDRKRTRRALQRGKGVGAHDQIAPIAKFNEHHDEHGRFASADGTSARVQRRHLQGRLLGGVALGPAVAEHLNRNEVQPVEPISNQTQQQYARLFGAGTGAFGGIVGGAIGGFGGASIGGISTPLGALAGNAIGDFLGQEIGERTAYAAQASSLRDALARALSGPGLPGPDDEADISTARSIGSATALIGGGIAGGVLATRAIGRIKDALARNAIPKLPLDVKGTQTVMPPLRAGEPSPKLAKAKFQIDVPIIKTAPESAKRGLVYGWASIIEKDGVPIVDHQGDVIDEAELVKAAHHFAKTSRKGGVMHQVMDTGDVVESVVLTKELQAALGIDLKKVGWLIAYQATHPKLKEDIASGRFASFSIAGRGDRTPMA